MANISKTQVRIRVEEADKKAGVTFADLCELVDQGREHSVDPTTIVYAERYIKMSDGRDGGPVRWLEV